MNKMTLFNMQVALGIICLTLNLLRDCRLHLPSYHFSAKTINYISLSCSFAVTALNLMISAFDPSIAKYANFNVEQN